MYHFWLFKYKNVIVLIQDLTDDIDGGMKRNNFDLLRIVLASIVVFYHIGALTINNFLVKFPGVISVQCFFVISGYLITRSYLQNRDLKSYFKARFFRVYPLYFIVVFVSFIVGFMLTSFNLFDYFQGGGLKYLVSNLSFLNFIQPSLPGVFTSNTHGGAINGSLWTIKVEVMFYFSVPLIYGLFVKCANNKVITIILYLMSIVTYYVVGYMVTEHGFNESLNNQLPSFMSYFMVGAYFNFIKNDLQWVLFLLPIAIVFLILFKIPFIQPVMVGVVVYSLAFIFPKVKVSKNIGDLSYGIYIWHFPVIQLFFSLGYYNKPFIGVIMTVIIVFSLAYLSWHFIEKRFVKQRKTIVKKPIVENFNF